MSFVLGVRDGLYWEGLGSVYRGEGVGDALFGEFGKAYSEGCCGGGHGVMVGVGSRKGKGEGEGEGKGEGQEHYDLIPI